MEELQTSIACGAEAAKTVSLTEEQLQNYYGIKVIPDAIPDGYVQTDEEKTYQIGYDADGNVIDDTVSCVMRTVRQRDGLPFAHAQRTWGR